LLDTLGKILYNNLGGENMYETKVILALLAEKIANAESIEEIYFAVQNAASV